MKASRELAAAYKAIPSDLAIQFPLHSTHYPCQRNTTPKITSQKYMKTIGASQWQGFARVQQYNTPTVKRLKSVYRARYCDPADEMWPKLIEVRSRLELLPPVQGSELQIECLVPAVVLQVGGFKDAADWNRFPLHGKGGVALDSPSTVHQISGLSEADFNKGMIWWAVVEFP
jgi:hypothetical protein